jgi:hypothetical protein
VREQARNERALVSSAELATDIVFGLVESVITWFERTGARSAEEVANAVAVAVVRSVVRRPASPERLRAAADRLQRDAVRRA